MTQAVGYMAPERLDEALKNHTFTMGLAGAHLERLVALAEEVRFREDQIIFRAGERSPYLYLLISGSVCLEIRTPVYSVCVQALGPGEAFGWSSLLDQHYTVFQVRARESAVALRLDAEQLSAACRHDPALGAEMFRRLAELLGRRLRATESRLGEFCGISGPAKSGRPPECSSSDLGHRRSAIVRLS